MKRTQLIIAMFPQVELVDQTPDEKLDEADRQKSIGDGHQAPELAHKIFDACNLATDSLCSVDKMRISKIISELVKCKETTNETSRQLAVSNSENEAIRKKLESWYSENDSGKKSLESMLSREAKNFYESTTNISRSLGILADQISGWERETALVTNTLGEILKQKIYLQKETGRIQVKVMLLTAQESKMKDSLRMDELYAKKLEIETDMKSSFDAGCQTEGRITPVST